MLKEGFEQIFRRAMNLRNTQVIKHLLMVVELKGKIRKKRNRSNMDYRRH